MPIATRTFRVFISSTFEDLKEERNALQKDVFPALRRLCEQHGARFQAIDLRWGVRDEAALDQKTVEICLREIERCQQTGVKPNFIVLLGQRYGWRPLPARIEASEFEAVRSCIANPNARALVSNWYERDDNAVPAEFVLKPRTGEWVNAERWQELETRLHGILLAAGRAAGLAAEALVKYWASATHQEILKGLGTTEEERRHVFAFCRDIPDEACDPDLADLRQHLKGLLPAGNFLAFQPGDLAVLCSQVEDELSEVIRREAQGFESKPALDLEREAHDAFAQERSLVFGRENVQEEVAAYLRSGDNRPLVLHGASGCGKSAIMARASEDVKNRKGPAVLVRRFIGASPESLNGLTLLRSLCEQIGMVYGSTAEIPVEFNALARLFAERLELATAERPLILFLDALDQLGKDDPARSLYWVSAALPAHCRIVLSTTELAPALGECEVREIEALREADAGQALDHWLTAAKRKLAEPQRGKLLAVFERCGLPLYLKLAFEEARLWPSNLPLEQSLLGEGVEGVIDTLLDRLSLDANHGQLTVSRSLGYLAAARYGLTEDEILDVLSADEGVWRDFKDRAHHTPPEQRMPVIVWSRLFLDLEAYLAERTVAGGAVVSFYHRQLAERVEARFLAGDHSHLRQTALAQYFGAQAHTDRQVDELPTLLCKLELWDELKELVTNIPVFLHLRSTERWREELHKFWIPLRKHYDPRVAYSQALAATGELESARERPGAVIREVALFHLEANDYAAAEPLFRQVLSIAEEHQEGVGNVTDALVNLTSVLMAAGSFDEAESYCLRALKIIQNRFGLADRNIVRSLNTLAMLFEKTDRLPLAELVYRKALAIMETAVERQHPDRAVLLSNLGGCLRRMDRLNEAEPIIREALAIQEANYGRDHASTTQFLTGLATLLRDFGRLADAEALYRQVLTNDEVKFGANNVRVANDLGNLADLFYGTNRIAEAEDFSRRALAIWEKDLGPTHPKVAEGLASLGRILRLMNRLTEAESLFRRSLDITQTSPGLEDAQAAGTLDNLAELLRIGSRYREAEPLFRHSLQIRTRILGPKHHKVAESLNNLALLLRDTNRTEEAEEILRQSLAIYEESLGPNDPEVAVVLDNLAGLLRSTNRLDGVEELYLRALSIVESSLGPEHPKVATRLNNIAVFYDCANRMAESEPLYRRSLQIRENCFGPNHPEVAAVLSNLAMLLARTNRIAEAEPMLCRALAIDEQASGPSHPNTARRLRNLAAIMRATYRPIEAETLLHRAVRILLFSGLKNGREPRELQVTIGEYSELLAQMGRTREEVIACLNHALASVKM